MLLTEQITYDIFKGPFQRARVGFHPDEIFSRVVFDLFTQIHYEIEAEENLVIINIK